MVESKNFSNEAEVKSLGAHSLMPISWFLKNKVIWCIGELIRNGWIRLNLL